jgi:hypothetical protein
MEIMLKQLQLSLEVSKSHSAKSLFMALIFEQQKMITQLIERLANLRYRQAIRTSIGRVSLK